MATNRYILQTLMFFLIIPNCIGAGELTKGKMIGNWLSAEMSTGSLVSSTSEKSTGVNFNIAFYSEKNCNAMVNYTQKALPSDDVEKMNTIKILLRIDDIEPWSVAPGNATIKNELSVDETRALSSIYFNISNEFIKELTHGNKLRIKIGNTIERFDLSGSDASIKRALILCFDKKTTDSDSHFFRNEKIKPSSMQNNLDAKYF